MTHSKIVTEIRRLNRYVTSDFALLNLMDEDFSIDDGIARLADVLGVPVQTASDILNGLAEPDMNLLAHHYGYMPDEEKTGWRMFPMEDEPFEEGPPARWDHRVVEYLLRVTAHPSRSPDMRKLAWRMDTTETRLRDAMRGSSMSRPADCPALPT